MLSNLLDFGQWLLSGCFLIKVYQSHVDGFVKAAAGRSSDHLHVCSWFHGVLQLIAATYDPARFAFNVSPRRVRENSRNIFVRLVLARAVPERIQWILTVLLKKRNFDRWIKRWRTDVPTANNCLCIMVMAYLISKTAVLYIAAYIYIYHYIIRQCLKSDKPSPWCTSNYWPLDFLTSVLQHLIQRSKFLGFGRQPRAPKRVWRRCF